MVGQSPRCYIPSFIEIGPPVPAKKKKIFKVFTIYDHGGHLVHVTWTIYINFSSPFLRMLHMKFDIDWTRGFRGEELLKSVNQSFCKSLITKRLCPTVNKIKKQL